MLKDQNEEEKENLLGETGCWERLLYNTKFQIILVLVLCAFIGIGTPFIWQQIWNISPNCCRIESDLRYDCFPEQTKNHNNKDVCKLADNLCCWDPLNDTKLNRIRCYYRLVDKTYVNLIPGYSVVLPKSESDPTVLELVETAQSICVVNDPSKSQNQSSKGFPTAFQKLYIRPKDYDENHFSVKISTYANEQDEINDLYKELGLTNIKYNSSQRNSISFTSQTNKSMFSLSVRRDDSPNSDYIFNSGDFTPFIFCDGFIEITTLLPNDLIYGLGQSPSKSFKHNLTYPENWSIFNKYNLNLTINQTNWFGSHPFYMGWTNDNKAYGVLLFNSHPIQLVTNSRPSLTFRTIGGSLDFHFFLGPEPKDVIMQLTSFIGKPQLPPYWALGFHLCRTVVGTELKSNSGSVSGSGSLIELMGNLTSNTVPFDTDCGNAGLSALMDPEQANTLNYYFEQLKTLPDDPKRPLVVQAPHRLKDSSNSENDWTHSALRHKDGLNYLGRFYLWNYTDGSDPNKEYRRVIFTSFGDKSVDLLKKELNQFGPIEATFLDYNTPLDLNSDKSRTCSDTPLVWNEHYFKTLNEYTPCLNLEDPKYPKQTILWSHNLYGYNQMKSTSKALKDNINPSKRKLIMSLSTFLGSGVYGGHIGTNMNASWDMLLQTHIQTLEFNMYGIPLVGFPVCGFKGQLSDGELCLRWYQLAALQPFMISYRDFDQNLTDPYSIDRTVGSTFEALKSSILIRYRLLPYFYSLFHESSISGQPVVRPLFYHFHTDKKTYRIDKQYLLGPALMASPVTEPKAKSVNIYFPKSENRTVWYDYYSGRRIVAKDGQYFTLSAIEYHINLHLRGGFVIPTQPPSTTTQKSRQNDFQLIGALDLDRQATGWLYIDDGETTQQNQPNLKSEVNIISLKTGGQVNINNELNDPSNYLRDYFHTNSLSKNIDTIKIFGVIHPLFPLNFTVVVNNRIDDPIYNDNNNYIHDEYSGVLILKNLGLNLFDMKKITIFWNYTDWDHFN